MRLASNPVQMTRWFSTAGNAWGFNMKDSITKIKLGIFLIIAMTLQACIDENPSQNESQRVAALIGLQVESAPVVGKTCRVMPSSLVTPEDFALRISQVSDCTVQENGSVFTDTAFPNPVEYRFGPSEPQSGEIPPMGASDNYLSQCRTERENYIRTVTPQAQYACWSNQYKNVVDLLVTTTSPRTSTRVCANFYDIGGSLRHSNDWACIDNDILTTDPNYTPINFSFGANGCPADQRSLPANISGISGGVRNATTEELSTFNRNAVLMGNCNPNDPNAPFIFYIGVPKELGRIGFRFYETHSGFMRTSVWDGGQFSSEKIVRFDLRVKSPFPTLNAEMCRNARDEFVAQALPTMKVDVPNPTQNSAFCYSGPANANFELSTTDLAISQPEKECYHLENSPYYLCYPKLVEHSSQPRLVTRLQVTNTAISASSRCTSIAGSGLPAALVQDVCITETLIDPIENWAAGEPNDPNHQCTALHTDGKWDNRHCDEVKPFSCQNINNPNDWKQTDYRGRWEEGFTACNKLPGGPYVFEKPDSTIPFTQSNALSNIHARALSPADTPWINYYSPNGTDSWAEGDHFQRLVNPDQLDSATPCAILKGDGSWQFVACNYEVSSGIRPLYACRAANAAILGIPQFALTEVDGPWENGFEACKKLGQGQYRFDKPQSDAENLELTDRLSRQPQAYQTAWLNFGHDGTRLRVLHPYLNFQGYPADTSKRCASIHTNGQWNDSACTEVRPFTCRNRFTGEWRITELQGSFEQGFRACSNIGNDDFEFASPRSQAENAALVAQLSGRTPWLDVYLFRHAHHDEWEPASPFEFAALFVNRNDISGLLQSSGFNSLLAHMGTPISVQTTEPSNCHPRCSSAWWATHQTYEYQRDAQGNLTGITIAVGQHDKLLRDDLLYVLAQAAVDRDLGKLPDDLECKTEYNRYPRLLRDRFDENPSDECLLRETAIQLQLAYLMHGDLSLQELDTLFKSTFPLGSGRHELLTGDLTQLDLVPRNVEQLGSTDLLVNNPRRRLFLPALMLAGIFVASVGVALEVYVTEHELDVHLRTQPVQAHYAAIQHKTSASHMRDQIRQKLSCTTECAEQVLSASTLPIFDTSAPSCHTLISGPVVAGKKEAQVRDSNCTDTPTHVLCESTSGQLFSRENHTENALTLLEADTLCGSDASALRHPDHLDTTTKSRLDTFVSGLGIDVQVGLGPDYPQVCQVLANQGNGSFQIQDQPVTCDTKARILCQNLQTPPNYRITAAHYPLAQADQACINEFSKEITDNFDTRTQFYFAATPANGLYQASGGESDSNLGTGFASGQEGSGGQSDGSRKRKFDWAFESADKLINPLREAAKKIKSVLGNDDTIRYHQLKTLSIDVGQGSCHAVVCDARMSQQGVETVYYDCGSSGSPTRNEREIINQIKIAAGAIGASYQLLWSGAFFDTEPTLVVSHPDKDHYNYIRTISLMPFASLNNITGFEDVYFGGQINQYAVGNMDDYLHGLYQRGLRVNTQRITDVGAEAAPARWQITGNTLVKTFEHCGGAQLRALAVNHGNPNNTNENSIVMQLTLDNFYSAILPGDALGTTEQAAMPRMGAVNAEHKLLIASHHGSELGNSNSQAWQTQIRPTHLIYSSGGHRGFNHPHHSVFSAYNNLGTLTANQVVQHGLCTGATLPGGGRDFLRTDHIPTAHYSTFSSGSITSTVFIPQNRPGIPYRHELSMGYFGPQSQGQCDGVRN